MNKFNPIPEQFKELDEAMSLALEVGSSPNNSEDLRNSIIAYAEKWHEFQESGRKKQLEAAWNYLKKRSVNTGLKHGDCFLAQDVIRVINLMEIEPCQMQPTQDDCIRVVKDQVRAIGFEVAD